MLFVDSLRLVLLLCNHNTYIYIFGFSSVGFCRTSHVNNGTHELINILTYNHRHLLSFNLFICYRIWNENKNCHWIYSIPGYNLIKTSRGNWIFMTQNIELRQTFQGNVIKKIVSHKIVWPNVKHINSI